MVIRPDDVPLGATTIPFIDAKQPPQVLVVDDAEAIRRCLDLFLRSNGYRVLETADGQAAQMILRVEHPELVISDLDMPIGDGWELLSYCHAQHPTVPVLITSGAALGKRPEIERWAAGYLPKPFSFERIRAELHRLVGRAA